MRRTSFNILCENTRLHVLNTILWIGVVGTLTQGCVVTRAPRRARTRTCLKRPYRPGDAHLSAQLRRQQLTVRRRLRLNLLTHRLSGRRPLLR